MPQQSAIPTAEMDGSLSSGGQQPRPHGIQLTVIANAAIESIVPRDLMSLPDSFQCPVSEPSDALSHYSGWCLECSSAAGFFGSAGAPATPVIIGHSIIPFIIPACMCSIMCFIISGCMAIM